MLYEVLGILELIEISGSVYLVLKYVWSLRSANNGMLVLASLG